MSLGFAGLRRLTFQAAAPRRFPRRLCPVPTEVISLEDAPPAKHRPHHIAEVLAGVVHAADGHRDVVAQKISLE
jgi:hypothetical protein